MSERLEDGTTKSSPKPSTSPFSFLPQPPVSASPRFSLDEIKGHPTGVPGLLRQFKKAKSAATFTLDGISYTIVASSPERSSTEERKNSLQPNESSLAQTGPLTLLRRTYSGSPGGSTGRRHSSIAATTQPGSSSKSGTEITEDPYSATESSVLSDLEVESFQLPDSFEVSQLCSVRLKHLLSKLQNGEEPDKDYLLRNIESVVRILDGVFVEETKSVCDDEDELNKVETEAVPSEVRDWLAMTFTRPTNPTTKRQNADNKPKFRSVANAIRAGIHVDKLWRRISTPVVGLHIPSNVLPLLKSIDDWTFDVFSINEASDGHALKFVGYELLQRHDLIGKFKINVQVLENFLVRLEQGYSKYNNPYHNLVHAADVAQTMHHVITKSGLAAWLTDLEILSAIISALIHDFEHTGTTNTFHVNTSSDVALLYNDKAVLENHHVSSAFRVMKEEGYNVVSGLKTEEYREFRSLVIDIVLATDMSYHFQQIKNMKSHLTMPETIDKTKALSLMIHCADISHPAKDWNMHHRWTELLIEEFFRQGDREEVLGLPISPLCDRKNTLVAQSQIGFIDFIVHPSLDVMGDMVDRILFTLQQPANSSEQQQTDRANNCAKGSTNSTPTTTTTPTKGSVSPTATTTSSSPSSSSTITASSGGVQNQNLGGKSSTTQKRQQQNCSSGAAKIEITRCWDACLAQNKGRWKERAAMGWISPLQEPRKTEADNGQADLPETAQGETESKSVDDQTDSGVESPILKELDSPRIT